MSRSKILYLLRHAKSDWNSVYDSDWSRPLNKRGAASLPIMADKLKRYDVTPDLILSSDAKRAQQTITGIAQHLNWTNNTIDFKSEIYHTGIAGVIEQITAQSDDINTLMIVGHNPTLTQLANHLSDINTANLPTCACVAIRFSDDASWQTIVNQLGTLLFFEYPKK